MATQIINMPVRTGGNPGVMRQPGNRADDDRNRFRSSGFNLPVSYSSYYLPFNLWFFVGSCGARRN